MRFALAIASLTRHRARTLLAIAGIAVSAAMLLDMVMLASGMRESFRGLLEARGFQVRLSPKGTLPFDTEATVGGASAMIDAIRRLPSVETVAPVLGAQLHHPRGDGAMTIVTLGLDPRAQGDYALDSGAEPLDASDFVTNAAGAAALRAAVGDTLAFAAGYDPQLRTFSGRRTLRLAGIARFFYLPADQPALALNLATLQAMGGPERTDRISVAMVRLHPTANAEAVAHEIGRTVPRISALTTSEAVKQADERLSYFRQLAFILGSVSLAVGFLLVTTLMTVSVNERIGDIAVQRAIGVQASRVVLQIVVEGLALSLMGSVAGLGLGLITGRYLNTILRAFPGLPPDIDFFLFQPSSALSSLGMLVVAGMLAGIYPSWRAARLPIALTLREEAIA